MSEFHGSLQSRARALVAGDHTGGRRRSTARDLDFGAPLLKGAAPSDIAIEICSDLSTVAGEWRVFERRADCMPFQSLAWLQQWQRHIGALRGTLPVLVFGRDDEGELLFILPLALERHGPLRVLTWLGVELGDYNGPLLAERFSSKRHAGDFGAVWKAILVLLRSDARLRFDLIDLPKMPEMINAQKNPFLQLRVLPNRSGAYVATLGANWDDYYVARRSASTRKTIRRKQKQLEELGEIRFVEPADSAGCAHAVATLIEQKSRLFARMGVENIFLRQGYRNFYLGLVTEAANGLIHVSRLDVGKTIAAANVGLQSRGCYYLILSSYHDGEMARFGPGRTHLHELLRRAIERGFRYFDFTIGDEPYKRDWADSKLVLYDYLAGDTARGWLVASAVRCARKTKRVIKQTPLLWRLAVNFRALGGRLARRPPAERDESH